MPCGVSDAGSTQRSCQDLIDSHGYKISDLISNRCSRDQWWDAALLVCKNQDIAWILRWQRRAYGAYLPGMTIIPA